MAKNTFGEELRRWRNKRGRSQLELAAQAGYSQRHLSFLESGRSKPSRKTVLNLVEALDVPVHARNGLLQSAGFAPVFSAEPISSDALRFALQGLSKVLDSHRPFPALIVDRAWNMYAANLNALVLFNMFTAEPIEVSIEQPLNVLEMSLSENGIRTSIQNWPEFASIFVAQLKRDLEHDPADELLAGLIHRFGADPELRAYQNSQATPPPAPFATITFARNGVQARLMTLVSQFAAPADSTLASLRVETFFPADQATRELLHELDRQHFATANTDPQVMWLQQ